MPVTDPVEPGRSDASARTNRMVFVVRTVIPVVGLALLAVVILAAVTFAWVRVALVVAFVALAALALVGAIVHARLVERDRREFPPSGIFSDAGGFRLHLLVAGAETGKPTVVLEGGMASFALNWHWVQTELSKETRVLAYDRAGFGWSEVSPNPRDAQHCARELHTALGNAGIGGPYVLAGWSFGGLVVRAFADLAPDEVVGLVLVDASHPDQWLHMPVPNADRLLARMMRLQAELCRFGYGRVVNGAGKVLAEGLPEVHRRAIIAWCALRDCWKTESEQARLWNELSRPQVNQARSLGKLPVYVVSVGEQPLYGDALTRLQEDLTTLSSNTTRRVVEGATHESLVADPRYAAQVTDAIRQVIESAQTG
jgi:pimeloyl-ACP methyl ester carboxylesterase